MREAGDHPIVTNMRFMLGQTNLIGCLSRRGQEAQESVRSELRPATKRGNYSNQTDAGVYKNKPNALIPNLV